MNNEEKLKEAIIYLASQFNDKVQIDIAEILCNHKYVEQIDQTVCKCNKCGKLITIEYYRKRLEKGIPGILLLLDGTKEYRPTPV